MNNLGALSEGFGMSPVISILVDDEERQADSQRPPSSFSVQEEGEVSEEQ